MKWYFVVLIVLVIAVAAFAAGRTTSNQVVDTNGKPVKGKFISTDGATATLKS